MKQCWTDGDLRAYLDRELPGPDRDRAAAHLAECGECGARFREIEARAERVATALSALVEGIAPVRMPAAPTRPVAKKVRLWPRWATAAAVAAGLAMLLMSPEAKAPAPAVAQQKAEFVALDNEPIDAGLVVRVSLGPDNVQADVIVSADGRARAYRLVDAN
jgi:anti-sigma factor RsiW